MQTRTPESKELRSLAGGAVTRSAEVLLSPQSVSWPGSGMPCQPRIHKAPDAPMTPGRRQSGKVQDSEDVWVDALDAPSQALALADSPTQADDVDSIPLERPVSMVCSGLPKKGSKKAYYDYVTRSLEIPQSRMSMNGMELCRHKALRLIRRQEFDYMMGFIIFANTLTIGYEITLSIEDKSSVILQALEHIFLVVYIIELVLRVLGGGREVFQNKFVVFDMALVTLGVLCTWIIDPLTRAIVANDDALSDTVLDNLMILRVARLLRLVRTLRLIVQFKTLWRLANGLLQSLDVLLSTTALLVLSLYVFACAGVEFITLDPKLRQSAAVASIVDEHFSSLPTIMVTLFRFATLDSIAAIYTPIIQQKPMLTFYFFTIALVVSIALMNLVTAVLVESTIQRASRDTEMERVMLKQKLNTLTPLIRTHFALLDWDNDGYLDRDEIAEEVPVPIELMNILNPDTDAMMVLFDILDTDDSGKVDEEEFVEGVLHMAMTDVPVETQQMMKLLRLQRRKMDGLTDKVFELFGTLSRMEASCTNAEPQPITTRFSKPQCSMKGWKFL